MPKDTGAIRPLRVRAPYDAESCHPPAFSLPLFTECVEGEFCEVPHSPVL
jgi:hypothetical protein